MYSYVLPSIDWDTDLAPNLKLRASYGHNIGRPGFNLLVGGVDYGLKATPTQAAALVPRAIRPSPLLLQNLTLLLEYYYAKSSYVAAGAFYKKVTDCSVRAQSP